jgi:AcrR family transcriptional regulator
MLQALEKLLKTKEFDQIAVTEIAHEAGVAVGSIYSHFADKDAFLEALLEEWRARLEERLDEVRASDLEEELRAEGSLRAALHMVVQYNYEQLEQEKHIIRATHHYLRQKIKTEADVWRRLQERAFETVAAIVEVYSDEVRRSDPVKAAKMLNYSLNAIFTEWTVYSERGIPDSLALDNDEFVHEAAELVFAYLTTPD